MSVEPTDFVAQITGAPLDVEEIEVPRADAVADRGACRGTLRGQAGRIGALREASAPNRLAADAVEAAVLKTRGFRLSGDIRYELRVTTVLFEGSSGVAPWFEIDGSDPGFGRADSLPLGNYCPSLGLEGFDCDGADGSQVSPVPAISGLGETAHVHLRLLDRPRERFVTDADHLRLSQLLADTVLSEWRSSLSGVWPVLLRLFEPLRREQQPLVWRSEGGNYRPGPPSQGEQRLSGLMPGLRPSVNDGGEPDRLLFGPRLPWFGSAFAFGWLPRRIEIERGSVSALTVHTTLGSSRSEALPEFAGSPDLVDGGVQVVAFPDALPIWSHRPPATTAPASGRMESTLRFCDSGLFPLSPRWAAALFDCNLGPFLDNDQGGETAEWRAALLEAEGTDRIRVFCPGGAFDLTRDAMTQVV